MTTRKIRVVWLCTPWGWPGGGTTRRLTNWVRFLDWRRFEVTLILGGQVAEQIEATRRHFQQQGPLRIIHLERLYPVQHWLTRGGLWELRRCLEALAPDILHTIYIQSDIAGGLVRRSAGVHNHISSLEGALVPWFTSPIKRVLYKLGYAMVRNRLDAIVALCQATGDDAVRDFGAPRDKIHVIYSGLDLRRFAFKTGWPYSPAERPHTIGMIGRLSREKIPSLFVAAAPYILERYPHVRFVIGGSGPEEETLKRFAKELGVSNRFEFMGWTNEVATILQTLDIFVFTSKYGSKFEGLPWAVLEAQAVGVPTIASAVGGVPEVIEDGRNGVLLHSDDPKDLAEKVIWMIEHRDHAADMGQAGRRLIESRFTIEREVGELQALYEELFNKG